jgi:hypothetical protein
MADILDLANADAKVTSAEPINASFRIRKGEEREAFLKAPNKLYPTLSIELNPSNGVVAMITAPSVPGNCQVYEGKITVSNKFAWTLVEKFAGQVVKTW